MPTKHCEIPWIPQDEATDSTPPRMRPDDEAAVFDARAMLANIGGDEDLFGELICLFLSRQNAMISNIQTAMARGDSAALQHAAHTLKGTAGNLCAVEVVGLASQLEAAGRLGTLDKAPALALQLERAVRRLVDVLSREIRPV